MLSQMKLYQIKRKIQALIKEGKLYSVMQNPFTGETIAGTTGRYNSRMSEKSFLDYYKPSEYTVDKDRFLKDLLICLKHFEEKSTTQEFVNGVWVPKTTVVLSTARIKISDSEWQEFSTSNEGLGLDSGLWLDINMRAYQLHIGQGTFQEDLDSAIDTLYDVRGIF